MKTKPYLPYLLGCLLLCCACRQNEPEPDLSGITQLPYSYLAPLGTSAVQTSISIYPNPFFQDVTVEVQAAEGEAATLYFSDEKGKYTKKIMLPDESNSHRVQVDFSNMPTGIYICEVRLSGKVSRYRLIKAR
ncbi:T9SS type A sorting domain-containing protein [Pontibacter liquoris]|uniref:T9SS type A sorting domain-containing protein n=1 Tax=Pontibacter liquoris TaxID=2905677 RepID=UPI001FA70ECD|nr:T9SS type A sorting domain-containing protein [Pontibacter liquoris]